MANEPRLYVKDGVDLNGMTLAGARILAVVAVAPLVLGFDITITCGREGHPPTDPHTLGSALDLRTADKTSLQIRAMYKYFGSQLGAEFFTTLYEVPLHERPSLDPLLVDYVYTPSNPDEQHLHLQRRINTHYPGQNAIV